MIGYKQLSFEERVQISKLRQSGYSITLIGEQLGRSKSTISRELNRNAAPPGEYWPDTAQHKTLKRRIRGCILVCNKQLQSFVTGKMVNHYWTPEQISGYLKYKQKSYQV
jgi:IS30 family transposase